MRLYYALALPLLLAGCGSEPAHRAVSQPKAVIRVTTEAVAETNWPTTYEATGTVRAKTTATISSKIMGYAREVRAQVGDQVRQGQVLVVLDARDLESHVTRAEAGRLEVRSAISEAEGGILSAKAQLDLAQLTFHRMQDLFNKKSITNQELDEASARLKASQSALAMAQARRAQVDAKLAQVEQEISAAGINRSYSQITAPFAGTIITKLIEPGTLAVPGAPLFVIDGEGAFRLEAAVEESRLSMARLGKAVAVRVDGIDRTLAGSIVEIVPMVDAAARSGMVKIGLPSVPGLRSGSFGRAVFETGLRSVMSVPAESVLERGQLQSVFVAGSNVAHLRMVTLGNKVAGKVEVLSGLSSTDRVIVPIPDGLSDGTSIEVRQ